MSCAGVLCGRGFVRVAVDVDVDLAGKRSAKADFSDCGWKGRREEGLARTDCFLGCKALQGRRETNLSLRTHGFAIVGFRGVLTLRLF